MTPRARFLAASAAAVAVPRLAEAHLVNTGLGAFYDGVTHLALTPEDILPIVALGFLAGLCGPRHGRRALFTLTAAWLVFGLLGAQVPEATAPPFVSVVSFLLLGALVAANARVPAALVSLFAALLGCVHGFLGGAAMARAELGWGSVLGTVAGVFVLAALSAGLASSLQGGWPRVAVRVAGSWIAAVGILMLGWTLR
jgi:hydrogenase/urease accessory protein HupE